MEIDHVSIRHTFTDAERLALGEDQARHLLKTDELEATLKSAKAQIQAQIDQCTASIRVVSSKLRDRFEFRDVECMVLDHRENGTRHLVRTDTGHVAKVRKLRADELQQTLTAEPQPSYVAMATCPVDDDTSGLGLVTLFIYQDELDVLRDCPDVQIMQRAEEQEETQNDRVETGRTSPRKRRQP